MCSEAAARGGRHTYSPAHSRSTCTSEATTQSNRPQEARDEHRKTFPLSLSTSCERTFRKAASRSRSGTPALLTRTSKHHKHACHSLSCVTASSCLRDRGLQAPTSNRILDSCWTSVTSRVFMQNCKKKREGESAVSQNTARETEKHLGDVLLNHTQTSCMGLKNKMSSF